MRDILPQFDLVRAGIRGSTAHVIVHVSRTAVLIVGSFVIVCYRSATLSDTEVALFALALGIGLMFAYPRHRVSDLMAALAVWLSAVEAISAWQNCHFNIHRWVAALSALGVIVLLRHVQDFRVAARQNPRRPIAGIDRSSRTQDAGDATFARGTVTRENGQSKSGAIAIDGCWRVL
jgi:hypothetical protein